MAKLFCISDVHGFYDEMKNALDEAGFDPNNEEHWLVGCGDFLDRGSKPQEVIDYLMSLPRKILVKGNHCSLLIDFIKRGYPLRHDWHNCTAQTIMDLAPWSENFEGACVVAHEKVKDLIGSTVDYFETKNYIFVHSFVPLKRKKATKMSSYNIEYEADPDWRNADAEAWEHARWGNPYELAAEGLLPDKTLVFGHYHTSWPRHKYEGKDHWGENADFSIYYGDGYIAIDGCTAYSGKVNVLVLEDEFLEE